MENINVNADAAAVATAPAQEGALYVPEFDAGEIVEDGAPDFLSEIRRSFWD